MRMHFRTHFKVTTTQDAFSHKNVGKTSCLNCWVIYKPISNNLPFLQPRGICHSSTTPTMTNLRWKPSQICVRSYSGCSTFWTRASLRPGVSHSFSLPWPRWLCRNFQDKNLWNLRSLTTWEKPANAWDLNRKELWVIHKEWKRNIC